MADADVQRLEAVSHAVNGASHVHQRPALSRDQVSESCHGVESGREVRRSRCEFLRGDGRREIAFRLLCMIAVRSRLIPIILAFCQG